MPSGFVLLLSQQFWIPSSWKPALNLVLFVSHNHLQRVLQTGAGCCCSQLEPVTNARAPETGLAPHLGAGCVAGKQTNPQGWEEQPLCLFIYLSEIAPTPAFLSGGHLMELSQEPQTLCFLPRLVVTACTFTASVGQRARSCFAHASNFISCHSMQLLRSPTLYVLLMKTGDRAGVVQGVTFLLKATSTRGKQIGLCFFVDSWCYVEEGPRNSFIFFLLTIVFLPVGFWCL